MMVAETVGAKDRRAVMLSYLYASALDEGKMGGSGVEIPPDAKLSSYASHLQPHFPKRKAESFCKPRST
eukprot:4788819-Prymnesium_polylepis.1